MISQTPNVPVFVRQFWELILMHLLLVIPEFCKDLKHKREFMYDNEINVWYEIKLNFTHRYFPTVACRCLALLTRPERTSSNLGFRCALSRWFDLSVWNCSVTIICAANIHIKLWPIVMRAHGEVTTAVAEQLSITDSRFLYIPVYVVWVVFLVLGFFWVFLISFGFLFHVGCLVGFLGGEGLHVRVCVGFLVCFFLKKGDRKYLFPKAGVNICLLAAFIHHGSETPSNCLQLFFCHLGLAFDEVDEQSGNKATRQLMGFPFYKTPITPGTAPLWGVFCHAQTSLCLLSLCLFVTPNAQSNTTICLFCVNSGTGGETLGVVLSTSQDLHWQWAYVKLVS